MLAEAKAKLIIVCGLPGAGKTTHAKNLELHFHALRLSADDWMDALQFNLWDEQLRARIEALQWSLAKDLLRLGQTVIIEWGTWACEERDALRTVARESGASVELHFLDPPIDVLFQRIQARNMESPPIQREDLVKWSEIFQRPTPEEIALFDEPLRNPLANNLPKTFLSTSTATILLGVPAPSRSSLQEKGLSTENLNRLAAKNSIPMPSGPFSVERQPGSPGRSA